MQRAAPSSDEILPCVAWQSLESCHAARATRPFLQAQLPAWGPLGDPCLGPQHSPNTVLVLTKGLGQTPGPFSIPGRLGQEQGAV